MSERNPYSAPISASSKAEIPQTRYPENDQKKIQSLVRDASQFWLAIVLCFFCSAIGALIIPFWYTFRLFQWSSLAKQYPSLTEQNAPKGSMEAKFQSSKWKLVVGLVFGGIAWILLFINIVTLLRVMNEAQ